jgi:hypothetical protein
MGTYIIISTSLLIMHKILENKKDKNGLYSLFSVDYYSLKPQKIQRYITNDSQ